MIKNIVHWFEDRRFRQLFKNAGILLSGNIGTAGCDLVSLALTARALGPELFGVLVLIQTYVRVVDSLINFQSWQAIIKYGADMLVGKHVDDFKRLIKFGTILDFASASFGTLIAILLVPWIGQSLEWDGEQFKMATIYSGVIIFNLVGTPTAVLRLYDKFKTLAMQRFTVSVVKMVTVTGVFLWDGGAWAFLLVWMAMAILDYVAILGLGWYELHRQGFKNILFLGMQGFSKNITGLWKFVATTNLSSSIRLGAKELDVLVVGGIIDASAAGLYKIAKQFGGIPTRFSDPLQQSIYPDLARLWAEGASKKFQSFILRIGVMSGLGGLIIWVVFLIAGKSILAFTVGEQFLGAFSLLLVYMIGYVVYMFGVAFRPAVLSLGAPERILVIYTVATVAYFAVLVVLLPQVGVIGASIAQIVFHSFWFVCMALSIKLLLKQSDIIEN